MIRIRSSMILLMTCGTISLCYGGQHFNTYKNTRFGVTSSYPASWRMGKPPANNDGRSFTSPDGRAQIIISGSHAYQGRAEEFQQKREPVDDDERILTVEQKGDSIIVSGINSRGRFYRKNILSCRESVWNELEVTYPAAESQKYELLISELAKTLRPGSGYDTKCRD
jgi:hypothetical protein